MKPFLIPSKPKLLTVLMLSGLLLGCGGSDDDEEENSSSIAISTSDVSLNGTGESLQAGVNKANLDLFGSYNLVEVNGNSDIERFEIFGNGNIIELDKAEVDNLIITGNGNIIIVDDSSSVRIGTQTGSNNDIKNDSDKISNTVVDVWSRGFTNGCTEEYRFDQYGNLRIKSSNNFTLAEISLTAAGSSGREEMRVTLLADNDRTSCAGTTAETIEAKSYFFTISGSSGSGDTLSLFDDATTTTAERSLSN